MSTLPTLRITRKLDKSLDAILKSRLEACANSCCVTFTNK